MHKEATLLDDLLDAIRPKTHDVIQEILDPLVESAEEAGLDATTTMTTKAVTALEKAHKICKRKEDIYKLLDAAKLARIGNKAWSEALSETLIIGGIAQGTGWPVEKVTEYLELIEEYTGFGMEEIFENSEKIKASIGLACAAIRPI